MTDTRARIRRTIGASAFAVALLFVVWLPLGVLEIVPFVLSFTGASPLRMHAAAAVATLLLAAWGFWDG